MNHYTITENQIRSRVGERSFTRGKRYYQQGAIMSRWLQGDTLKAQCWGSMPQPYHIWLQVGPDGIVAGECSCPVGSGGACKHVAALLLTWLHEPDSFQETEPLEKALEQRDKRDLIHLIRQMIARYPDLGDLAHLAPTTSGMQTAAINPDLIRRQVQQAIKHGDYGHAYYGAAASIANQLQAVMQQADVYEEQDDWLNATVIYRTVLEELLNQHSQIYDHDGDLGTVFWQGGKRLGECLEQTQRPETRLDILRTLVDVIVSDTELGGYGFADSAYGIVLDGANAAEKAEIATWIEDKLADIQSLADNFSQKWRAESYGRFLLDLHGDTLTDEQFLQLCRRSGQLKKLVERLLQLNRVEEAVATAQTASDYELLAIADLFVAHDQATIAEGLVWERAGTSKDGRLADWLKKQAVNSADWPKAIQYAESQFWQRPTFEYYQDVKSIAEKLGDWPERQPKILSRLTKQEENSLLTRIYVLENDIDAALKTLPQVRYGGNLSIEVAKAAETTHPREAIGLYQQKVTQLIGARGRGNYAEAAKYLHRVKNLYGKLGEGDKWIETIRAVRDQKPRLPALLDELRQAGL
jgi:uncharacterized Zn finger protein